MIEAENITNDLCISKIKIQNYKCFQGVAEFNFDKGVNILVGNNEAGKSTILEAINLALSGILNGRYLRNELSQYIFNQRVINDYLTALTSDNKSMPPEVCIEVFFAGEYSLYFGDGNICGEHATGISFKVQFDPTFASEYQNLVENNKIDSLPIEYYQVVWSSFARDSTTARSIPLKSVLIDSSSTRFQNGSDVYISRIIRENLEDIEKVQLSQAYRQMKDGFRSDPSICAINAKILDGAELSNKTIEISVDLSTQNSWENTLMTYLDDIPFHQIGKGEQCVVKTSLALNHNKSKEANVILIEEPENHLTYAKLNQLIKKITDRMHKKQIIISTHSSFVANKLGLEKIQLINGKDTFKLRDLPPETFNFFKKLPGYKTLRLILCDKAVFVEGDSDELIFQRAYMDAHNGKLPIEDEIDVISVVGLSFKRFLDIATKIKKHVAVITDNDGDYEKKIARKYSGYEKFDFIKIFASENNDLKTLEPQFTDVNKGNQQLEHLCKTLGQEELTDVQTITDYMAKNKTTWALQVFESDERFEYPEYIKLAVNWCNE